MHVGGNISIPTKNARALPRPQYDAQPQAQAEQGVDPFEVRSTLGGGRAGRGWNGSSRVAGSAGLARRSTIKESHPRLDLVLACLPIKCQPPPSPVQHTPMPPLPPPPAPRPRRACPSAALPSGWARR